MNLLKNYRKKKGYSGNYTYKKFINGQGLSPWNKMWYGNVEGKRTREIPRFYAYCKEWWAMI